jgi:hypothetical protein
LGLILVTPLDGVNHNSDRVGKPARTHAGAILSLVSTGLGAAAVRSRVALRWAEAARPPEELVSESTPEIGRFRCQRLLGGLLRHYYRVAA